MNGEIAYLWRAVDDEGEVRESYVARARDKAAVLTLIRKALKRHGSPERIPIDWPGSYRVAMTTLGCEDKQEIGRWANNRGENSDLPLPHTRLGQSEDRARVVAMLVSQDRRRINGAIFDFTAVADAP